MDDSDVKYTLLPVFTTGTAFLAIPGVNVFHTHQYYGAALIGILFISNLAVYLHFRNKRKKVTPELADTAKKVTGELTSAFIHEINQPLCVMHGYMEILKSMMPENDPNRTSVDEALAASARLSQILRDMRDFANMKFTDETTFDAETKTSYALDFIRSQFSAHGIGVELKKYGETFTVSGSGKIFSLAVFNVLFAVRNMLDSDKNTPKKLTVEIENCDSTVSVRFITTAQPRKHADSYTATAQALLKTHFNTVLTTQNSGFEFILNQ